MSPLAATAALLQKTIRCPSTSVTSRSTTPVVVLIVSSPACASAIEEPALAVELDAERPASGVADASAPTPSGVTRKMLPSSVPVQALPSASTTTSSAPICGHLDPAQRRASVIGSRVPSSRELAVEVGGEELRQEVGARLRHVEGRELGRVDEDDRSPLAQDDVVVGEVDPAGVHPVVAAVPVGVLELGLLPQHQVAGAGARCRSPRGARGAPRRRSPRRARRDRRPCPTGWPPAGRARRGAGAGRVRGRRRGRRRRCGASRSP